MIIKLRNIDINYFDNIENKEPDFYEKFKMYQLKLPKSKNRSKQWGKLCGQPILFEKLNRLCNRKCYRQ